MSGKKKLLRRTIVFHGSIRTGNRRRARPSVVHRATWQFILLLTGLSLAILLFLVIVRSIG